MVGTLGLLVISALAFPVAYAEVRLTGRVTDANSAPVSGTRIALHSSAASLQTVSDPTGVFQFDLTAPGDYSLSAEREGYFQVKDRAIQLRDGANEVTLVLNPVREQFESVQVSASPPGIDFDKTVSEQVLSGADILEAPYPTTHSLRNAMRLLPNAIQDSAGGIHINGGGQEQVLYTLDGFNLNDPLTGRLESRLSVEAVRSLEVSSGAIPAEFGKGSAATMAVKTGTGDDKLRYSGTNFVPGVASHKGLVLQDWTPRFGLSGPIEKGRAWFSDSADAQYTQHVIEELPRGHDRTASWNLSNLLHTQVNLTPSNIFYTGFLLNYSYAPRSGLSVLDPPPTTIDQRARQWFLHLKDQVYFGHGALAEFGFASNQTFRREIPQGHGLYLLTPDGKSGNYYVDSIAKGSRDQFLTNVFLPSFHWHGSHQIKAGADLDRVRYWQNVQRTGYENFREDGTPVSEVRFGGSGLLARSNYDLLLRRGHLEAEAEAAGRGRGAPGLGCAGGKYERLSQIGSRLGAAAAAKYEDFGGLCRHSGSEQPAPVYPPSRPVCSDDTFSSRRRIHRSTGEPLRDRQPRSVDADLPESDGESGAAPARRNPRASRLSAAAWRKRTDLRQRAADEPEAHRGPGGFHGRHGI